MDCWISFIVMHYFTLSSLTHVFGTSAICDDFSPLLGAEGCLGKGTILPPDAEVAGLGPWGGR